MNCFYGLFASSARQRPISACRNWPNASGVLCFGTRPISVKRLVMSGVSIASGCVLGAGAIATTSSKPCQYLVGVPARAVRDNASWTRNPVGASAAEKSFFARMKQA